MSEGPSGARKGPCPKIVLAAFGGFFVIALLSVPVTISESSFRQDPGSQLIFRTSYPKNSTMFLPSYLAAKAGAKGGDVRLRSTQWFGTMAVVIFLGLFDSLVVCRLLERSRRRKSERGPGSEGEEPGPRRRSSGLSLFP